MTRKNEAVVRRLIEEVINQGQTGPLAELIRADHVGHDTLGDHYGPEGVRISVAELRTAFPDLRVRVEDMFAAGDRVVHRFMLTGTHSGPFIGLPATGRPVQATGIAIDRIADGKLAERWVALDTIRLLRQLGGVGVLRQRADKQPSTQAENSKRR